MKTYSSWPTFPQLYIGGEFFGGCDITMDAYKDGSLKEELERAMLRGKLINPSGDAACYITTICD